MKFTTQVLIAGAVVLLAGTTLSAQYRWGRAAFPRNGVCFYEDINYGGRYFCAATGEEQGRVPGGTDDEISSLRIFGNAEATVFRDSNLRGQSRRFTSSISDLRRVGFNDRITSFVVVRRGSGGGWGGAYGGGGWNGGHGGGYGGDSNWGGAYGGGSHGGWGNSHGGSRWTYQQAEQIVRRAYRSTFDREMDPAARPWINEVMKNNWSQAQLEARLRQSPEYRERNRRR